MTCKYNGCTGLTSITIPNSVTTIGQRAFLECRGLTSVSIPNSVTSFGDYVFSGCSGLTSITIPNSVTSIGVSAFRDCSGLTSVTIPNSVTSIGIGAFSGCTSLTSVTIPNSVTSIGVSAFSGCSGLTSITIPNSVTSIGDAAFSGCNSLTSITIPHSVTSIGKSAFSGCSSLTSVTIPNNVTSIGEGAFNGCFFTTYSFINNSTLTSSNNWGATLYDGEEDSDGLIIGNNTVKKCRPWVISVTIPESVTSIGDYAFSGCTGLTSITIPNSVISIGENAFAACSSLTSITIPNSVASIGEYAIPIKTTIFTSVEKSLLALWNAGYNNIKEVNTGKELNIPILSLVKKTASSLILNMTNDYPKYFNCTVKGSGTLITKENGNMFLTGLNPNTSYNNLSIALALENVSYTTSPISAKTGTLTLTTQQPKIISLGNAILSAKSNLDDEEVNVGFEWRRIDWTDDFASNTGTAYLYEGTMEGYIRNLYTERLWKYRPFYESNSGNRYYGEWVGIDPTNTNYFEPTVRTYATITVTGNRAEVKGYAMRGTDRVTSQGFMYWKASSLYSLRKRAPSIPSDAVTVEASGNVMTAVFENLDYETQYCYVAFVKTEENETFFGEVQTFSTNADPDGIREIESLTPALSKGEGDWYDLSGRKLDKPQNGINIIRYADGTSKKVLVK